MCKQSSLIRGDLFQIAPFMISIFLLVSWFEPNLDGNTENGFAAFCSPYTVLFDSLRPINNFSVIKGRVFLC